jgi:hypothetical protein
MSAHTKGPWSTVENSWSDISIVDAEGNLVAKMSIYADATEDNQAELEMEMARKAKLIASAPDLLDFAKRFLEDYQSEDGLSSMKHYAGLAHMAIAKATGREK